jgi:protein-arginine kinase
MFSDLFDPLIRIRYNYAPDSRQYHDIDITKLQFPFESDKTFDINKYILSSRIRITRNLAGFTFPTFSTRAERRRAEGKLNKAFQQLIQENNQFNGNYYRLSAVDDRVKEKLVNVSASM